MKTFIYILLMLAALPALSQNISGKIISNEDGKTLPGSSVKLLKSNYPIPVNAEGKFSFNISNADTLVITHIGYKPYKLWLDAKENQNLVFRLKRDEKELEEVNISTGYQIIPKERATGSFALIDRKLFNDQISTNILERLPNVSSSVTRNTRTAKPGFSIRGLSTIDGPKSPLIVLDNFPYNGDLSNLNPHDVESITILKDAAASSIWGAKAGNGVIVITTKKGKFNQPLRTELVLSTTIGKEPDLKRIKSISPTDLIDVETILFDKGVYKINSPADARKPVSPVIELLRKHAAGELDATTLKNRIDVMRNQDVRQQYSEYFYQPSVNQQYSLTLSSGMEKLSWKATAAYDLNQSELDAKFKRKYLSIQTTLNPLKNLDISGTLLLTQSSTKSGKPGYGQVTMSGGQIPVYTQFADAGGNSLPLAKDYSLEYTRNAGNGKLLDWDYYPLEDWKQSSVTGNLSDITADFTVRYKVLEGLTVSALYRYQRQQSDGTSLNGKNSYFARNLVNNFSFIGTDGVVSNRIPIGGILDLSKGLMESNQLRGQINFDRTWGNHNLNLLAGGEINEDTNQGNTYRTYGYDDEVLSFSPVNLTSPFPQFSNGAYGYIPNVNEMYSRTNRFVSAFFNSAYTYKNQYILSLSARRDGSNLFGVLPNNKFNPLGSVGLAWDVSRAAFFKVKWLEYLKLRTTIGMSGNTDQNRTAFATITYLGNSLFTQSPLARILAFANPELKWEKVMMKNFGLDFRLKNNRVSGSVEFYLKNAKDLFGRAQIDYTGGAGSTIVKNVGKMSSRGIDIELNTINLDGQFKWTSRIGHSSNQDKIDAFYSTAVEGNRFVGGNNPIIIGVVGKPLYPVYSYKSAGLDPQTGEPRGHLNGEISKNYNAITNSGTLLKDLVYHGSAMPQQFGFLSNTLAFRDLSLTVSLNYKLGYYVRKSSINYNQLFNSRNGHSDFSKRWQKHGDELITNIPSMIYPAVANKDAFYSGSEVNVIKGDHIRIQYANLNYAFTKAKSKWLPFPNLNIFLNANNIGFIWRANKDDIDPDYLEAIIPQTTTFSFGLRTSL